MSDYFIFDAHTHEFVGLVRATDKSDAEFIAAGTFLDHGIMYAIDADTI